MSIDRLRYLFERHLSKTCTPQEKEELSAITLEPGYDDAVKKLLLDSWALTGQEEYTTDEEAGKMLHQILKTGDELPVMLPRIKRFNWRRIAAAAAIFIVLAGVGYWWLADKKDKPVAKTEKERFKNDVTPGSEKAVLMMADGRRIELDGMNRQTVDERNGSHVRSENGVISYNNKESQEVVYHTLVVPRKGEYELKLSDGSTVKLNAESSVYYPTDFTGSERRVTITGEAYFDIAKNADKPFIVTVKGAEVKVLGTKFNVNAYDNEAVIRTTLEEGSVQVMKDGKTVSIKPGQQARLTSEGELVIVNNPNMNEVFAWTTGYFNFHGANIETIMRQVERWYDVDVVIEDKIGQLFMAEIPRTVNAVDFFRILEATGWVKFTIEGRKVTVTK